MSKKRVLEWLESSDLRSLETAIRRLENENSILLKKNEQLEKEIERLSSRERMASALEERLASRAQALMAAAHGRSRGKRDGAFVMLCSDWHCGERVDPETVGNLNEYSPAIARRRVKSMIEGALWTLDTWRSRGEDGLGWDIPLVVCWLGGDLITNTIHEDQAETNYLSPVQEVMLASELCRQVLDALAQDKKTKKIIVPCSFGNHGRDTQKMRVSSAWKRSYEWLMYSQLAAHYEGHQKITVIPSRDELTEIDILGWTIRFTHGHQVRYGGGVGGLTVPLRKWLQAQNETRAAHCTCIGHFHQYLDIGDAIVNNSMIGYSPYARRMAPYSRPSQVCFLIDRKYGKRMSTEVILE